MSRALAIELNYLEEKSEELERIERRQVEEGGAAARQRRRGGAKEAQVTEINNSETTRLVNSLNSFH